MTTCPLTSTPSTVATMTVSSSRSPSPPTSSAGHPYTHPNVYQQNHLQQQPIANHSPPFHSLTQPDEGLAFESSSPRSHDLSPIQSQNHLTVGQTGVLGQHSCMWANCHAFFGSLQDLVAHVNAQHLQPVSASLIINNQLGPSQDPASTHHQPTLNSASQSFPSCHWGNCHVYPTAENVPGSSNRPLDAALGVLAAHLWEYHFGLPTPPPQFNLSSAATSTVTQAGNLLQPSSLEDVAPEVQGPPLEVGMMDTPLPTIPAPLAAAKADPAVEPPISSQLGPGSLDEHITSPAQDQDHVHDHDHDCATAEHPCKWLDCQELFASCETLMAHITAEHVGSGKNYYGCFWDGCGRNGESGFKSKQKICRHLQVRFPQLATMQEDISIDWIPLHSRTQDIALISVRSASRVSQRLRRCNNTCDGIRKRVRTCRVDVDPVIDQTPRALRMRSPGMREEVCYHGGPYDPQKNA